MASGLLASARCQSLSCFGFRFDLAIGSAARLRRHERVRMRAGLDSAATAAAGTRFATALCGLRLLLLLSPLQSQAHRGAVEIDG